MGLMDVRWKPNLLLKLDERQYFLTITLFLSAAETGNYSEDLVKAMLKFIEELLCGEQRYSVDTPEFMLSDDEWSYLQSSFLTPEALRHLIMMVEVTEGEIELWNTDFDDFIDNEDIRNVLYGRIRRKALELIVSTVVL